MTKAFVAALLVARAAAQTAADDLITNLPGWSGAQNMYSGYVSTHRFARRCLSPVNAV